MKSYYRKLDWWLIICYLMLVITGWLNIYSSIYTEEHSSILDFSQRYGMQFIWILSALAIAAVIIFVITPKVYSVLSPGIYLIVLALALFPLVAVEISKITRILLIKTDNIEIYSSINSSARGSPFL